MKDHLNKRPMENQEHVESAGSFWQDALMLLGFVVLYFVLQIWVLPAAGVPT